VVAISAPCREAQPAKTEGACALKLRAGRGGEPRSDHSVAGHPSRGPARDFALRRSVSMPSAWAQSMSALRATPVPRGPLRQLPMGAVLEGPCHRQRGPRADSEAAGAGEARRGRAASTEIRTGGRAVAARVAVAASLRRPLAAKAAALCRAAADLPDGPARKLMERRWEDTERTARFTPAAPSSTRSCAGPRFLSTRCRCYSRDMHSLGSMRPAF